jgi:hypothetical protein
VLRQREGKPGRIRGAGVYAIVAQRETRLSYRDVMIGAAIDSTCVLSAGGVQQAEQQHQAAAAAAEVLDEEGSDGREDDSEGSYSTSVSFEGEDDGSEDHTDGSPQLGERQGMCEHHTGGGSHGCRSELGDGEEIVCADCSEQDEYGRCGCECDQCDESNKKITAGLEAFKLAYGRTAGPEEWRQGCHDGRDVM